MVLPLFKDAHEDVRLEQWAPGAAIEFDPNGGLEVLVLDGASAKQGRLTGRSHGCGCPGARTSARARPPMAAACGSKRATSVTSRACNPRPRWSGGSRITGCCRPDWDRGGREPNRQSFRRGIHGLCSRRASHSARSSSDHRAELYGFMCAGNHYGRDRHRWDAAERSAIRTCPKDRGPLL